MESGYEPIPADHAQATYVSVSQPPNGALLQDNQTDATEFVGEELIKTWTMQYDENYNRVVLSSHRVVFQSRRVAGRVYPQLTNTMYNGMLDALFQLASSTVGFVVWCFTFGTERDSALREWNMLLRDVIEIRVHRLRYSDVANHARLLLFCTLIFGLLIMLTFVWPVGSYIGTFLNVIVLYELMLIGSKLLFDSPDFPTNRTRQLCFLLVLGVFACWIIYWSLMLSFLYGDFGQEKMIAACVFVSLAILMEGVLLRFVYVDKTTKGIVQLVGRRSTITVALRPDDAVDVKRAIWASRKDVNKL